MSVSLHHPLRRHVREALDLNTTADALNTNPFEHELTVGEFGGHAVASDRYSVQFHGFAHSHMDALTHFSHKGKLYNGVSVGILQKGGALAIF